MSEMGKGKYTVSLPKKIKLSINYIFQISQIHNLFFETDKENVKLKFKMIAVGIRRIRMLKCDLIKNSFFPSLYKRKQKNDFWSFLRTESSFR